MDGKWYTAARIRQTKARDDLLTGLRPLYTALESNAGTVMKLGMRATVHYASVLGTVQRLIYYLENISMNDMTLRSREQGLRRAAKRKQGSNGA